MATSVAQRVSIAVVAAVMGLGTLGFYFLTIATNNEQSEAQKILQEQLAKQQKTQNCAEPSANEPILPVPEVYKPGTQAIKLESTDLEPGSGVAAKNDDCLVVKYYGTLASDGTKFDENFTTATAFAFILGAGDVIEGWDKGMVGMKPGGLRRLVIPSAQAYGPKGSGPIPANADLVFMVKLLKIKA